MRNAYLFHPMLAESTLAFRIRLAEKRLSSYPLDNLDFIMVDLEHPPHKYRHAHQCTTDLTGRTMGFLATAQHILPHTDAEREYLHTLARRILLQGDTYAHVRRFMPYLRYTHDPETFATIRRVTDGWIEQWKRDPTAFDHMHSTCDCYVEGLAWMYEFTGRKEYAEIAERIARASLDSFEGAHSHGMMTVLRSMLTLAGMTGDAGIVAEVNEYRKKIRENQYPDGSVAEAFPRSYRNEGCSIADWVILNLRYYRLTGDREALDDAEHSLFNGLFGNQFVTGGFGHRWYAGDTEYGTKVEEAWWCCTQTGGMAMCAFAENAVQLVDDHIEVLFPIPGEYTIHWHGKTLTLTIASTYPAEYSVLATLVGDTAIPMTFRQPYYAKNMRVTEHRMASEPDGRSFTVTADIGHYAEKRREGYVMKYGPLLLAPMLYDFEAVGNQYEVTENSVPEGYIREQIDGDALCIVAPEDAERDENGFWRVACGDDLPLWLAFDDGPGSHTGTMNLATANITVLKGNGEETRLCFHPFCYATSNLTLYNVPLSFGMVHKRGE